MIWILICSQCSLREKHGTLPEQQRARLTAALAAAAAEVAALAAASQGPQGGPLAFR
jgi:hypothetical protein